MNKQKQTKYSYCDSCILWHHDMMNDCEYYVIHCKCPVSSWDEYWKIFPPLKKIDELKIKITELKKELDEARDISIDQEDEIEKLNFIIDLIRYEVLDKWRDDNESKKHPIENNKYP